MISIKIQGAGREVHIEGDSYTLMAEWAALTETLYTNIAKDLDTGMANKMFVDLLIEACNNGAAKIKKEGNE